MKKTVSSLLVLLLAALLCVPALAADGGFNAGVTISPVENERFTVTVADNSAFETMTVTLTVNCPDGWTEAFVYFRGAALSNVTVADGKISFPVAAGGVYTISKTAIVTAPVAPVGGPFTPPAPEEEQMEETKLPFTDVPEDAYYYDPVAWAVENEITSGTGATTFSPDDPCTRGQMVTFLWNLAGKPEPAAGDCPFTDLDPDAYYYDAVLWACGAGLSTGTTAATFSPDATVDRAQTVTFLYRYAGKPAVSGSNTFTDVKEGDYFYETVIWALEQGITIGTGDTTFSPGSPCNRGQLMTFLYRFAV